MPSVCLITTCMGRLEPLKQTLGRMAAQPDCSCILVDYSCPEGAGEWAKTHVPGVEVVSVPGRNEFNASIARNVGVAHARVPWLGFVDADVLPAEKSVEAVVPHLADGRFYRINSADGGLGGTFLCKKEDFDRVGGYDEVYRGWGEEDNDLYDALEFAGLRSVALPVADLVTHLPHSDTRRIRHYGDLTLGHAINRVYRIAKWDIARLRCEPMTLPIRQPLYDKAVEVVTEWYRSGASGEITIHLPPGIVPGNGSLGRSLSYRLT